MAYVGIGHAAMKKIAIKNFPQFVGRTVLVKDNDVEASMRLVNK